MKKSILFAAITGLLGSTSLLAVTGNSNPGQQGSLLVFPRIAVQDGYDTVVRITNNSQNAVRVKCFWVEQGTENVQTQSPLYPDHKHYKDFAFDLTRKQSVWFDAATGYGSVNVSSFPDYGYNGELKCWAVDATESQNLKHNFLSGTAEVIYTGGDVASVTEGYSDTHKYNANAFYLTRTQAADGFLDLNWSSTAVQSGTAEYDSCGKYIVQSFSPSGAYLQLGRNQVAYHSNILSWSGCTQDLVYDAGAGVEPGKAEWIDYRVQFEVFNADEVKKTGAFELGDSVWEVALENVDRNADYFTRFGLGTDNGYFRAWDLNGNPLVGVLTTKLAVNGGTYATHAVNTAQSGYLAGRIEYVPGDIFPESF